MRLALVCIAVCISVSHALTDEELAAFTGSVSITSNRENHILTSDGTPDHDTGTFPNDCNPNEMAEQSFRRHIPLNPTVASSTSPLNKGIIGYAVNGVAFFNPCTSANLDATLNEELDICGGHPDQKGVYHYHGVPKCLFEELMSQYQEPSQIFLGVALDGFPIYGPTDEPLDANGCNGRFLDAAKTKWQYHVSETKFPYILGCYVGEVTVDGDGIDTCDTGNLGGRCSAPATPDEETDEEADEGTDEGTPTVPDGGKPGRPKPRPRDELVELLMEILKRDKLIED
ncbi:uncharacterized protein [Amphiura filiformis]|uniref:uncharacterized protein n=1 Tax=Amphiura filiformis TaxID=82378 RepID=UPI003B21F138